MVVLEIILAIIVFILVLGAIILVHEAGHFFFAKKAKILCHEFSIGMGPVLAQKKKGETHYSIRAIPIGGYVSMAGEDMNEKLLDGKEKIGLNLENGRVKEIVLTDKIAADVTGKVLKYDLYSKNGEGLFIEMEMSDGLIKHYDLADEAFYLFSKKQRVQVAPYNRCFESKTKIQRMLAIAAGPLMNFVFALLLFMIVGLASGVPNLESNTIKSINSSYASSEFLKSSDKIIAINEVPINSWTEFQSALADFKKDSPDISKLNITVERKGEDQPLTFLIPTTIGINSIGISNVKAGENPKDIGIVMGSIPSGNKAGKAGIAKNDIIYKIEIVISNNVNDNIFHDINSWTEAVYIFSLPEVDDNKIIIHYLDASNNYEPKTTGKIEPYTESTLKNMNAEKITIAVGVSPTTHFDLIEGLGNGFKLLWKNVKDVFITLGMVLGIVKNSQVTVGDLSGPVGIFQMVRYYLTTDIITFIAFIGMLSVNIGIINLLPIPALDGGRLVFLGYEAVTRKPVNKKFETILNNIVFILLLALFAFITYKDILRL